jgi:hypothetical protein
MPATWIGWTKDIFGYTPIMTPTNERYVALTKVQEWLDKGYTEHEVALLWNSGQAHEVKGVNKYGVKYDSRAYALAVGAQIIKLSNNIHE